MKKFVLLVVLAVLLAGCGFGTPEAKKPFFIDEIELVITSVTTDDTYGNDRPRYDTDTFLIVNADVLSKPETIEVSGEDLMGAASLSGYWGRVENASITRTMTISDGESLGTVEWVFVVPRHARSFTLELEGGHTLELDNLLFFEAETPFYIDEVEMVITSVEKAAAYGDIKPTSDRNTFLVIYADVLSKPKSVDLEDLNVMVVTLSGDWGWERPTRLTKVSGKSKQSADSEGLVMWVFVVPRTVWNITLELPDGRSLVLDKFLRD